MPKLFPVKNKELIRKLKKLGYKGPYSGGKHLFVIKIGIKLTLPNPHRNEIGVDLLRRILKQANISVKEWLNVK